MSCWPLLGGLDDGGDRLWDAMGLDLGRLAGSLPMSVGEVISLLRWRLTRSTDQNDVEDRVRRTLAVIRMGQERDPEQHESVQRG